VDAVPTATGARAIFGLATGLAPALVDAVPTATGARAIFGLATGLAPALVDAVPTATGARAIFGLATSLAPALADAPSARALRSVSRRCGRQKRSSLRSTNFLLV